MARKATGTLVWHSSGGWFGRYWATVDGERKRLFVSLDTPNETLANKRLAALVDGSSADADGPDTFEAACERVMQQRARTVSSAPDELGRLRLHVIPSLGRMAVAKVTMADTTAVLEAVRDKGLSGQSIVHVRNAMVAVFKQLRRDGVVKEIPVPDVTELPECLPETIDDRPKAILSDKELLLYLGYTDPREGERFRGTVRERQIMALLSRCVGGMRTGELHGLTWARVGAEGGAFDSIEVIRYKARRKATRRGSKAAVRQVYPLGDTVLPMFLRFWYLRETARAEAPRPDAPLFPVRRARRAGDIDRTGERRGATSWAKPLRLDVAAAFKAAAAAGNERAPAVGSRRWSELFDGTDDRRPLWFHTTRNMAAVAVERLERLKASARFTGHASTSMLQHYREMAGEVDVVPMVPELLPNAAELIAILRSWCEADGIDPSDVFTPGQHSSIEMASIEKAYPKGTDAESPRITTTQPLADLAKSAVISRFANDSGRLEGRCSIQLSYGGGASETSVSAREVQAETSSGEPPEKARKGISKRHAPQLTATHGNSPATALPAVRATLADMIMAIDDAAIRGDLHAVRRFAREALSRCSEVPEGARHGGEKR